VGRDHPVTFSTGLSGDSYVLALTPRASSGLKVSAAYTAKSAAGFTIHVTPLGITPAAGATVDVDWVACEAR
jgi:hypothetical protein